MLFGNKDSFGIEFELDENYGGEWLFGKLCYWIDGAQVGDYNLGTSLRDVLLGVRYLSYFNGRRDGGELCNSTPEEIFKFIDTVLYGDAEKLLWKVNSADDLVRYNATINVDVFDGWKIYVVYCCNNGLLMVRYREEPMRTISVSISEFERTVTNFVDSLNKLYDNEIERNKN